LVSARARSAEKEFEKGGPKNYITGKSVGHIAETDKTLAAEPGDFGLGCRYQGQKGRNR